VEAENGSPEDRKLLKAVWAFETYVTNNRTFIPNYGERYRHGKVIATAFVESAVDQVVSKRFVKKQPMRWTLVGAHLLLQIRIQVLRRRLAGPPHGDGFPGWSKPLRWRPRSPCFVPVSREASFSSLHQNLQFPQNLRWIKGHGASFVEKRQGSTVRARKIAVPDLLDKCVCGQIFRHFD
jgi:hypothetical protein